MKSLHTSFLIARNLYTCNTLFRQVPRNLKGKKHSSQLWLARQLQDPYVEMAKQENYRCRSAFKLLEINDRFNIFKPGQTVIDCGAAPGSWTQVAVKMTNADGKHNGAIGNVIGIDRLPIYPIEGATLLSRTDFTDAASQDKVMELLKDNKADVVLSDMAPNASGIRDLDHDNIVKLVYAALMFALKTMRVDGTFVCKLWDGGKSQQLEKDLLRFYKSVKNVRPQATRDESTEKFFLARGFKGVEGISINTA
ncbi:mitochondrial rRNA methyltransferase 2 [Colletes latitarsis]|uniref:mitochondrial rRNA methyltransferase 2 n=1 Tax=Colletes latitarsis TaxID=2605962 RepID=UPI00403689C3